MRATPQEMIDIYLPAAEVSSTNLQEVKIKRYSGYFDIAEDFQNCFELYLVVGRIQWRHKLGDPTISLRQSVQIAHKAATTLTNLKPKDFPRQVFKFGSASAVTYLLGSEIEPKFMQFLPKLTNWRQNKSWARYSFLDAGLMHALQKEIEPEGWDDLLLSVKYNKKKDLLTESYRLYMEILRNYWHGNTTKSLDFVSQATCLYEERKTDDAGIFYSAREGGGITDLALDHRLASVIKYCFGNRPEILQQIDSIHKWNY